MCCRDLSNEMVESFCYSYLTHIFTKENCTLLAYVNYRMAYILPYLWLSKPYVLKIYKITAV